MAVALDYLYRDGSNCKASGSVVFAGDADEALVARLKAALDDGQWFIAGQVGVPEVFLWDGGEYEANEDDHCWHELIDVSATDAVPTDVQGRTFAAFVAQVEAAGRTGWDEFDPEERG